MVPGGAQRTAARSLRGARLNTGGRPMGASTVASVGPSYRRDGSHTSNYGPGGKYTERDVAPIVTTGATSSASPSRYSSRTS